MTDSRSHNRDPPPRKPLRGPIAGLVITVLVVAQALVRGSGFDGDSQAVLVLVEDQLTMPAHPPRLEERRVDTILVVRVPTSCHQIEVHPLPRDLIAEDGGEVLAVLYDEAGSDGFADVIERAFELDITAVVTTDVAGVAKMVAALGPVTIDLPAMSRDRRTGFAGGPGPVQLVGDQAIAYLRSREWEVWNGTEWQVVSTSDIDRSERTFPYLRSASKVARHATATDKARLAWVGLGASEIGVRDYVGTVRLIRRALESSRAVFRPLDVIPERSIDQRRSPFAPDDLGAGFRLVLEPGATPPFSEGCQ